jgi:hypothetical protein
VRQRKKERKKQKKGKVYSSVLWNGWEFSRNLGTPVFSYLRELPSVTMAIVNSCGTEGVKFSMQIVHNEVRGYQNSLWKLP